LIKDQPKTGFTFWLNTKTAPKINFYFQPETKTKIARHFQAKTKLTAALNNRGILPCWNQSLTL